jgi:hypothetical protein
LLTLGGPSVVALLIWVGSQPTTPNLWHDGLFVIGFVAACVATVLGAYILTALVVGLPLPKTRYERQIAGGGAQQQAAADTALAIPGADDAVLELQADIEDLRHRVADGIGANAFWGSPLDLGVTYR